MSTNIKSAVINYIQTTNKIKVIQDQIKQLRTKLKPYEERKTKLQPQIISYISNSKSNSKSKGLRYHNYKIQTFASKRTQTISKDYLEQTLSKYFNNDEKKTKHLLDYIYDNRKVTTTQTLRQTEVKTKT